MLVLKERKNIFSYELQAYNFLKRVTSPRAPSSVLSSTSGIVPPTARI